MALKKFFQKDLPEAGCDEAGRGCLAGPVFAAAVILDPAKRIRGLDDSKKLNEEQRNELRLEIEAKALAYAVAMHTHEEIDRINILKASVYSMHRALDQLSIQPGLILVDGNYFIPYREIRYETIVEGDGKYQSIAAASILAKTHRDEWMKKLHSEFPNYGWDRNKAYATAEHRAAIKKYGLTPYHRLSFNSGANQLDLF
jgi:ribonuclease HII